jgi:alpha/beta superfamily hydrolase
MVAEEVDLASDLRGVLSYPEVGSASGAVVIAGPHPLLGGTMHNNVVRGLSDGLVRHGILTLRFDYRRDSRWGDASNLAEFWQTSHVADELNLAADVIAAVAYVRQILGSVAPLALAGYSFGCSLLPHAGCPGVPCVLIGPTISKHDYAPYVARAGPKLVIASDDDFASDPVRLQQWFDRLSAPRFLILRRFDNHFFRGHEAWLADATFGFLREHWR